MLPELDPREPLPPTVTVETLTGQKITPKYAGSNRSSLDNFCIRRVSPQPMRIKKISTPERVTLNKVAQKQIKKLRKFLKLQFQP